jgi:O-antigen/teichoic acid export membrane protein
MMAGQHARDARGEPARSTAGAGQGEPAAPPNPSLSLRRLFGNATVYGAGQLLASAISLIADPIFSYALSRADFGLLGLTRSVQNLLANGYRLGLDGAAHRFYYEVEADPEARRRVIGTLNTFLLGWLLALTVAQEIFGPAAYARLFSDIPYHPWGRFVACALVLGNLVAVPQVLWAAQERAARLVALRVVASLLGAAVSFGLLLGAKLGVISLFWAGILASTLLLPIYLRFGWGTFGFAWDAGVLRRALAFGLPMVVHLVGHWALEAADRFILERYLGREAVGLYTIAYGAASTLLLVNASINGAYVPQLVRALSGGDHSFIARSSTYFLGASAAATLGCLALAPTFIRGVYAAHVRDAAALAPALALTGILHAVYLIDVNGLFQAKRTGMIPLCSAGAGAVNIALNLWWVPRLGLIGAAWATVLGYAGLAVLFRLARRRVLRLPFERGRLARIFGVAAPTAAAAWLVDGRFPLWIEAPLKVALLLAAIAALVATGFLTPEERAWIRNRIA